MRRFCLTLLGCLALAFTAIAAHAAQIEQRPSWLHLRAIEPSRSTISNDQLRLNDDRRAHYMDGGFPTAELLMRHELTWDAEEVLTSRTIQIREYLTDEGVRQSGNFSVSVRAHVEELWVDEAWIALPGDERRAVDLDAVQLLTRDSTNIFSDAVDVVIPFSGLVPEATAVLVTRIVERPRSWPLPWSNIFYPQAWSPMERFEVEMSWRPGLPSRQLYTDAAFLECTSGPLSARCYAQRIPALPAQEEQTIWLDVTPQLVVAEPHSWADLVAAEDRLVERSMGHDGGLGTTLTTLLKNASDAHERLHAIHRFVADEIRYLGLEHGPSAVAPSRVDRTLELRYGDCKGKVALFVALARRAGLRAYPVLVSTWRDSLAKLVLPSWQYFNHMIACVELEEANQPLCLDLTTPNARTGVLPPTLFGSVALELRKGVTNPRTTPWSGHVYDIDLQTTNTLDCSGNREESTWRRFRGADAVWERSGLRGLTVEDQKDRIHDTFHYFHEDVEPEVSFSAINEPEKTLAIHTLARFEDALPHPMTDYGEGDRWLYYYAYRFYTDNEHHPATILGGRIRSSLTYEVCPADTIQFVGPALEMTSEFGVLTRQYRQDGRKLLVFTDLQVHPGKIEGRDLERFRRFFKGALDQTYVWFRLERSDPP